ncbi:Fe-S cluster assembly protein SufD [Leucobacter sp. M11]|uniref:Fe-S cluster assembly protein SufD n=1 Tax=Leucobacter sp. M11 TaxID=2993565 RepID=UPI002D7FAAE1|nr:Fe-S cluster assembly protein SufD [Leucobacter sp. M11]MEB4613028.1 Fe-S cluster assembly protein SufD [Leucobacter sp. M11]
MAEVLDTAQHGNKAHTDGGWDLVPVQTRSDRFKSVDVQDFQTVTGREAVWKFAPIDQLDTLLNGELDGSRYGYEAAEVEGISLAWVPRAEATLGQAGTPEERGSAAAWTAVQDVLTVTVTGEDEKTLRLDRNAFGPAARAAHTIIEAKAHSRGLVILENTGDAQLSENVEIVVHDEAQLTVVTVQEWSDSAKHLASHFATVGRNASLKHIVVSLGGKVVRVNPSIHLNTDGGGTEALGAYFADAGQHLEQQVYIDHDAAHTRSRVTYKGALQGEGARTVWIGDVLIRQSGTGTDSYEQNRNLVLSDGTRADSIPNLEIETGDIAGAGHASATGRFDDEQLFYLMSRGISEEDARKLVVRGFLLEVVNQIGNAEIEQRLQEAIDASLAESVR